ncbi:hypothetical protein V5P93_002287 [Actinokineospora auranticolor]|uniref:Uncharacterized protein n=1 Tax=Actinokineospora auranticolor TaxID=155976 RepID=A0A2S6GDL8_9PSEU|nr:hypothetical protein [Actinokineospora auranticolor]PPK63315.1 hypothetical protein CLV40_12928 [Actinokineospora auranticolor]
MSDQSTDVGDRVGTLIDRFLRQHVRVFTRFGLTEHFDPARDLVANPVGKRPRSRFCY